MGKFYGMWDISIKRFKKKAAGIRRGEPLTGLGLHPNLGSAPPGAKSLSDLVSCCSHLPRPWASET